MNCLWISIDNSLQGTIVNCLWNSMDNGLQGTVVNCLWNSIIMVYRVPL